MNKNKKLIVIVSVLFLFIVILVALLIYAINVYKDNTNNDIAANTSISTNSNANQTASSTQEASQQSTMQDNIDLKLYFYDADDYDNPKEIKTIPVDKKLYQDNITAAINELLKSTNLKINNAVVSGNMITVDLPKDVALKFNSGSAGGITYTNILAMTILNLPGIEEMEVTVDGVKGVEADHFNFNGKFVKSENGQKYKLEESKTPSNVMDF